MAKDRLKAALLHLIVCACVLGCGLFVVLRIWYPGALFSLMGAGRLTGTMLVLPALLGPLLTFAMYKRDWRIILDVTIIALLQVAIFGLGMKALFEGRAVALTATEDRFRLVRAIDTVDADWNPVTWDGASLLSPPQLVYAESDGGLEYHYRPETYRPLGEHLETVRERALPMATIVADDSGAAALAETLDGTGLSPDEVLVFPLRSQRVLGSVVLEAATGQLVGITGFEFEDVVSPPDGED